MKMFRGIEAIEPGRRKPAAPFHAAVVMQKSKGEDVAVAAQRRAAALKTSRDHGELREHEESARPPLGLASGCLEKSYGDVRIPADNPQLIRRLELNIYIRMRRAETPEAGHEPTCGKCRLHGNPQALRWTRPRSRHRALNLREGARKLSRQAFSALREFHTPMQPSKQWATELRLQLPHVTADGSLSHKELVRGIGKAQPSCRCLESAQSK